MIVAAEGLDAVPFAGGYPWAMAVGLGGAVVVGLVALLAPAGAGAATKPRWGVIARLWFGAVWLGVVTLAASAAIGIFGDQVMHGWPLLVHATVGGAVLVGLAGLALGFARSSALARGWRWGGSGRWCFWISLVSGVLAGGAILASSLPLFGTDTLRRLLDIHRWSGLALAMAMVLLGALSLRRA